MDASREDTVSLALLGVCSTIRGLLVGAERDEVLTRHRVGEVLRAIKRSPHTYGKQSVERVAAELGMSAPVLYRYIAVAENWSAAELAAQMEKTNRFGQPASWSHFVALTKARDRASRLALLYESLANSWSVRELTQRMDRMDPATGHGADAVHAGEPVSAAFKEGVQTGGRAIADLRTFTDALDERLADSSEPVDDALLERVLDTFEELQVRVEAAIARLRGARQSQQRLRCAAPAFEEAEGAEDEADQEDDLEDEPAPSGKSRRKAS